MAQCKNCGTEMNEEKVCASCGTAVEEPVQTEAPKVDVSEAVEQIVNTPDTTAEYDPADINGNKGMAVLAYIGILWLIPLLAAKGSKYARYHTNQGLVLWITCIVVGIAGAILDFIPFIGGLLSGLLGLATLALMILGIVNAATGKAKELPVIGRVVILK